MRLPVLLTLCLCAAGLQAGAWGVDVGLVGGIGVSAFAGQPAGLDPASSPLPVKVKANGVGGLAGQAGFEVSLSRKRRWSLSLQPSWLGQSLVMDEDLDLLGIPLQRRTTWEWQSFHLPLEAVYAHPLAHGATWAVMARLGAGAFYESRQSRRKTLSSGVGDPIEVAWAVPPDDWGPLLGLGLEWLRLPTGRRTAAVELRASRGNSLLDAGAGAGLPVWRLQFQFVVPLGMWAL